MATKRTTSRADLGGLGEAALEKWCHQVGISPNKATHDKTGWDFLLVVPREGPPEEESCSLDLRAPEATCFVQVKTTRDATRPISIKLSNWERFATWPNAAFVLVIEVDKSENVRRVLLHHVGEDLIADVLKRLRRLPEAARDRLHKRSMTLRPLDGDTLSEVSGRGLLAGLRAHVGHDSKAYFAQKQKWIATVGYDDRPMHVTFTLPEMKGEEVYRAMADFAIGESKRLNVAGILAREVRFGIPKTVREIRDPNPGFIEVAELPSAGDSTVEVADELRTEVVRLTCKTYVSRFLFPFLPPEFDSIALQAEGVRVLVVGEGAGKRKLSWRIKLPEHDVPAVLGVGEVAARLMRMLTAPLERGVTMSITLGEAHMRMPVRAPSQAADEGTLEFAVLIEHAARVRAAYAIPADVLVTPGSIFAQAEVLKFLAIAAGADSEPLDVSVALAASSEDVAGVSQAAILVTPGLLLGDQLLVAVVALVGTPVWKPIDGGHRMDLRSRSPRIMSKHLLPFRERKSFNIDAAIASADATLKREGVTFVSSERRAGDPRPARPRRLAAKPPKSDAALRPARAKAAAKRQRKKS